MKHPKHQPDKQNALRVDLDGNDVDLLEMLLERLDVLLKAEEIFDSKMVHPCGIFGVGMSHITEEGRDLLKKMIEPWSIPEGEEGFMVEVE